MNENTEPTALIERNPFAFLDLSVRDDRHKILQAAEEKSLSIDPEICTKARADLTNSRNRLGLEVSWLPGVSPRKSKELLASIRLKPEALLSDIAGIEPLARANLIAAVIELLKPDLHIEVWSKWILGLAAASEEIRSELVLQLINEDRAISGFPVIKDIDQIEKEIVVQKKHYKECVKKAIDRLPSKDLVALMTLVVEKSTDTGCKLAPSLIDDIADSYQIEAHAHLIRGKETIFKIIDQAINTAPNGEAALSTVLDMLEKTVREWNTIAYPVQLSLKSRGLDHDLSVELGFKIRSLAIDIANKHDMLGPTTRITALLKEVFSGLPELSARLDEDTKVLDGLIKQKQHLGTPVTSAPSLFGINGCGFRLYGATDHDPQSKSHIATYYFTILFFPIFPITRYRVIANGSNYRFIGKFPLRKFDKCHLAVSCFGIFLIWACNK